MCLFTLEIHLGSFILRIKDKQNNLVADAGNGLLSYNNEFRTNIVPPENFNKRDWDLFLTICEFCQSQKIHKGAKLIVSFDDLSKFLDYENFKKNKKRFYEEVENFALKARSVYYTNDIITDDESEFSGFESFFEKIKVSKTTQKITFWFSNKGLDCLHFLEKFTQMSVKEFCSLRGVSSKMIFRVLIQHKNNEKIRNADGLKVLDFDKVEFIRVIMPNLISKSDKEVLARLDKIGSVSAFDKHYVKPAIDELNCGYFNFVGIEKKDNPLSKTSRKEKRYYLVFDDSNRDKINKNKAL